MPNNPAPLNTNTTMNNDSPALQYSSEYAGQPAAASLANLATAAGRSQQQQQQQHQQGYNLPPRMIPDPSTLANQYQMMQPPLNNDSSTNLPELQLPGLPRPNLPQNDGANDELTTRVKYRQSFNKKINDIHTLYCRKLINALKIWFNQVKKKIMKFHLLLHHSLVNLLH